MAIGSVPFIRSSAALLDWGGTQYLPLEITSPNSVERAVCPTNKAYTGLAWNIRICCIGGVFPYKYQIVSGAGSGMTINVNTGVMDWPNPQSNCTPTVRVTDTKGLTTERTWTVTVGTSGYKFVDAVNGTAYPTGTGTLANPWRTLEDVFEQSSPNDITYFRAGTYNFAGIAVNGPYDPPNNWYQAILNQAARSNIWLAYPGDTQPVIDWRYSTLGSVGAPAVDIDGNPYFDGLHFKDFYWKGFNGGNYHTRRCVFSDKGYSPYSNGSCMMSIVPTQASMDAGDRYGSVLQDTVFRDFVGADSQHMIGWLAYGTTKALIEDCTILDGAQLVSQKADDEDYTIRGCTLASDAYDGWGSNLNAYGAPPNNYNSRGELCFNNFIGPFPATYGAIEIGYSQIELIARIAFYRNTFNGQLWSGWRSGDGPFPWHHNIIVNADTADPGSGFTHFRDEGACVWASGSDVNNLKGVAADAIIDANGALQGSYRTTYLYTRGHERPNL